MPSAIGSPLVLSHDANRPEADLRIGGDGRGVVGGGVDSEAVVAVLGDEVPGQGADGVGAGAPPVDGGVEVDVDVGVAVVGMSPPRQRSYTSGVCRIPARIDTSSAAGARSRTIAPSSEVALIT